MRQRGRRSAASLTVVSAGAVLPGDRPAPPAYLTRDEADEWRAIVGEMPPQWFARESWPVLAELCGLICTSRRIALELERVSKGSLKDEAKFAKFDKLARQRLHYGEGIGNLSTKLRLTHQSRYERDSAANVRKQASQRPKPWELGRPDHLVDSEHVLRPGRETDWEAVPFGGMAAAPDQTDLQQPDGDAARDPELREEERQDQSGGGAAADASVRTDRDPQ